MARRERRLRLNAINITIAALLIAAAGGIGYIAFKKSPPSSKTASTISNSPTRKESQLSSTKQPVQQKQTSKKQYINKQYGISFSYPTEWRVEERDPAAASLEYEKIVLSVWLINTASKSSAEAAVVTVSLRSLSSITDEKDKGIDSEAKKDVGYKESFSFEGNEAEKYTIPQSASVNRIMYYIAAGQKTYSVQTLNEEASIQESPDYMTDFNQILSTLRISQ